MEIIFRGIKSATVPRLQKWSRNIDEEYRQFAVPSVSKVRVADGLAALFVLLAGGAHTGLAAGP